MIVSRETIGRAAKALPNIKGGIKNAKQKRAGKSNGILQKGGIIMFLYINGEKFHGENKKECIMEFLKQLYTSSEDDKIIKHRR